MAAAVAAAELDFGDGEGPPEGADFTQRRTSGASAQSRPRGHLAGVLEGVFTDLYTPPPAPEEREGGAEGEEAAADGGGGHAAGAAGGEGEARDLEGATARLRPDDGEVDVAGEEAEIAELRSNIEQEQQRIHGFMEHLDQQHVEAQKQDQIHAEDLKEAWGIVVGDHIPVTESKLKRLLDPKGLGQEGLILPRHMMEEVERWIEIKKGTIPHHDNLLAVSKPEEPNHFRDTAALKLRAGARNVQTRLTEGQRSQLSGKLEQRRIERPPMPPSLNGEEREKNKKIVQSMFRKIHFLKNPRFTTDRKSVEEGKPCPFWFSPDTVTFRDYQVGGVYEVPLEFKNVTQVGRRLRVLPCSSQSFSLGQMRYEGDARKAPSGIDPNAVIAPGMSAHVKLRFAPSDLNDENDELTIATEFGDYKLPVCSRRVQPELLYQDPVDCGCILAGGSTSTAVLIRNHGGEGSFRLVQPGAETDEDSCYYETQEDGSTSFVSRRFTLTPASFYLDANQATDIKVTFRSPDVGTHRFPLEIEGDNGKRKPLCIEAIADALRLELSTWPTILRPMQPREVEDKMSPWSLLPWQLNWMRPGVQVGCSDAQTIAISNGGNLPSSVEWRFVNPPPKIVSLLAVGGQQRLTDDILADIHNWRRFSQGDLGSVACPFKVSPPAATIPPFSTVEFTFHFHAHVPVAHRATSFAYLVAKDVPASGSCLLHYRKLLGLTELAQSDGYARGLPLFGGAVSGLFDKTGESLSEEQEMKMLSEGGSRVERASCAVTAVCLQGVTTAPSLVCMPRLLTLAGDALPFVSHTREVVLRNTGSRPAHFRVRITSRAQLDGLTYEPLWVVSPSEAGRSSRHAELPAILPPPGAEFSVTLAKADAAGLGMKVANEANRLVVQSISGGLVEVWNQQQVGSPVLVGDEVVDVNGTVLDAVDFLDYLKGQEDGSRLEIRLRRGHRGHLLSAADRFVAEWVPLPPQHDSSLAGYGAVATAAVEPDQGKIAPGASVKLVVTLRAPREADLNSSIMVDFPVSAELGAAAAAPPVKVGISACFRAPRVELRSVSFIDYGVVRAHARHTVKLRLDNPSDLPMLTRLREYNEEDSKQDAGSAFPMFSHEEVVNTFLQSFAGGSVAGYDAILEEDMQESIPEPWVHSRSGCLDTSGRQKFQFAGRRRMEDVEATAELERGIDDSVSFVFGPACVVLWPRQSLEVDVTLRTAEVGKFRALLEAVGFDSRHTQCIEVFAEVQLPVLRLSTQHLHFPITYLKTPTDRVQLHLRNDSDMLATFRWDVPLKMESGIEVLIDPQEGQVPPRTEIGLTVIAIPTKVAARAERLCKVFVGEMLQPLILKTSARVYGLEVDYAVVADGELPPEIVHQPRVLSGGALGASFPVTTGRAPRASTVVDFGTMELQKSKTVQLVLYNRSGISTPWSVSVERHPAYDPLMKGRSVGSMLDAATRMYALCSTDEASRGGAAQQPGAQTFQSEPQPAAQGRELAKDGANTLLSTVKLDATGPQSAGRNGAASRASGVSTSKLGSKFNPNSRKSTAAKAEIRKPKKFLLDDKHEKQAFRSNVGADFAKLKEVKAAGASALQYGHGWAVKLQPGNDWLQPFGKSVITLTCFSDLPGLMEDELVVKVRDLEGHSDGTDFRIPMRLLSQGNPLFLPDQQVGLTKELDPPVLMCGTMVPAEKSLTRTFKVSNNSAAKMRLTWTVYGKSQVNHKAENRQYVNLEVCKKKGAPDPFKAPPAATDEEDDEEAEDQEDSEDEMPFNFQMWSAPPPKVEDTFAMPLTGELPLSVEPPEAVLAAHGSAIFTVTMKASKATASADAHYHYKLVGKGRFTEDREALLAAAGKDVAGGDAKAETRLPSKGSQVRGLPDFKIEALDADDSDAETPRRHQESPQATLLPTAAAAALAERGGAPGERRPRALAEQPEQDVISTLVVDCIGDVIIPRLSVDKKDDPKVEDHPFLDPSELALDGTDGTQQRFCAMFKFMHSVLPHPAAGRQELGGTAHGGVAGGSQIPGIVSNLVRNISLTNRNECSLYCRFKVDGPFRILQISQVGKFPVKLAEPMGTVKNLKKAKTKPQEPNRQIFTIDKLENVNIQVEFVPDMVPASDWKADQVDNTFEGDLTIEYPREAVEDASASDVPTDLQRVHFVAISRKPAVRAIVVPNPHLDRPLTPGTEIGPITVDFGRVHVESSITRKRVVLLLNVTNVLLRWQLLHVGRKKEKEKSVKDRGSKEPSRVPLNADESSDERDVFHFDLAGGEMRGPSKDVLVPGSNVRMPRWFPVTPALPHALPAHDEHLFEPTKVTIAFRPTQNLLYVSRFRIMVDSGISADIICRGQGSFSEQDDCMDFLEA
mmetsp:Transcript_89387/g.289076  ORF Transcript_89387/g.289076 Transcript_89387/m.289076 type:complete len:2348 (-) Transcript_89387:56-7099(-)